jgi:hypothetical protein
MSKEVPYLLQGKNVILVLDGKSHTVSKDTHMNYGKIVDALKAKDWAALRDLVEPKKAIINFGKGFVQIKDDKVYWKDEPFNNVLAERMIEMYQEGFPIEPMVRFMERLMNNPSKRSVDQVYKFLEKNRLPITPDGYFLAYKRVNANYTDCHTGKISNKIGDVVEMDRNKVDDNPESHCSTGLHFCSESYLGHFGSASQPVMILKIDPADVVSVPTDYDGAKGRCCKYTVVAQVAGDPKDAFSKIVDGSYSQPEEGCTSCSCVHGEEEVQKDSWPFPTSSRPAAPSFGTQLDTATEDLYDVVRVYGGDIEDLDLTLDEARERVQKNIKQKKAQLKIVKSGTDEEVQ